MPIQHAPVAYAGKMESIEAGRALAAISVMLMHAANLMRVEHFSGHVELGGIFAFGYIGVDFFFVLSGFIITYVHFFDIGKPHRLPRYLWRRFSRIYPIYWFLLALSILLIGLGRMASAKGFGLELEARDILGTVLLIMDDQEPKYVGVAWTLQYEVLFYLAFSVLLLHARLGIGLLAAWGIFLLASLAGLTNVQLPMNLDNAHCLQFLLGIGVGVAARRFRLRISPTQFVAIGIAFILAIAFEVYGPWGQHSGKGRLMLGVAAAALLTGLVALEGRGAIHPPRWLVFAGSVSYSLYLGHILFINLCYSLLLKLGLYHRLPEPIVFLLGVGTALAATMLIGRYVELPLVATLKNSKRRATPPMAAAHPNA